ncbi:type II CAAX endopeptidase family protein [Actinomadura sp. 7K534]|uniref:CPBP family intramembrane glutamic endopeptidase n=1 Tax=Actinomadura sp. 7K534 TaxID=2530366 RepID=UPI001FB844A4|nr:type II CAAX endopeptidase family protein [Actinomadura sp. 7K534]
MTFSDQQSPRPAGAGVHPTEKSAGRAPRWAASVWVRLPLLFVLMLVVTSIISAINGAADATPLTALIAGVACAGLALAGYVWAVRYLEGRRTIEELPPAQARQGLYRGAALGLGLFTVTITLVAVFGGYDVHGWGSIGGALTTLGVMAGVAVVEELTFRGVLFRLLEEKTGTYGALAVSAIFFGGLHLVNDDATIWGALAIAIEAGLMLGAIYVATRSLWLPIGVHLAWNVAEQGIFGTSVSGSGTGAGGLLDASVNGPQVLTGGAFGPEASIFAILVCIVPTVLFLRIAKQRNRIHTRTDLAKAKQQH